MIGRFWLLLYDDQSPTFPIAYSRQLGNFIGGALDLVEIHYGFGRSMFYLNQHQLLEFGKYVYGEWIQTFATLMFTKVSICLFLLRIPVTKVLIRPLQAAVAFLVVSNVVLTLMWIFQCTPVDAAWNSEKQSTSRCFSRGELQRIIMAQASGSYFMIVLPLRTIDTRQSSPSSRTFSLLHTQFSCSGVCK